MDSTQKNIEITRQILNLIEKEKCTVQQTREIFSYALRKIEACSTVQRDLIDVNPDAE